MRKINILNSNRENVGLYAPIEKLGGLTLKEFFDDKNLVNFNSKGVYDGLVETVDESIEIGTDTVTLLSTKKYFTGFDVIFDTLPVTIPDSYRLWLVNQGITDTILHSFVNGKNVMLGDIKSPSSNIGPNTIFLNLFNLNVGETMKLTATNFNVVDVTDYDLTDEDIYYFYRMYRFLKDNTKKTGYTYLPKGASKYDVAYVNKTIDEVVYEEKTLGEIFGKDYNNAFKNSSSSLLITTGIEGIHRYSISVHNELNYKLYGLSETGHFKLVIGNLVFDSDVALADFPNDPFKVTTRDSDSRIYFSFPNTVEYDSVQKITDLLANNNVEFIFEKNITFNIEPTYAEKGSWFNTYLERKDITIRNLTYADIFELINDNQNPNFMNGFTGYTISGDGINYTIKDGYIEFTAPGSNGYIKFDDFIREIKKYYISADFKSSSNANLTYFNGQSSIKIDYSNYNLWQRLSTVFENKTVTGTNYLFQLRDLYDGELTPTLNKNNIILNLKYFDELITKEILDSLLENYLLLNTVIIYPELFLITEPIGFGKRFNMLTIDNKVYGHELAFENISFKANFGVNYNAYEGYNILLNRLKNSEAVIEYDWGIGSRYADVRLLTAPKTEKDTFNLLTSKFAFKLENPFYELIEHESNPTEIKNNTVDDYDIEFDLTVNSAAVVIELEAQLASTILQEIHFDFTGVTMPFNLTINPNTKKILINDSINAYEYLDHAYNSFITVPKDGVSYQLNFTSATINKISWKDWVID